jgi:hypothetical protein
MKKTQIVLLLIVAAAIGYYIYWNSYPQRQKRAAIKLPSPQLLQIVSSGMGQDLNVYANYTREQLINLAIKYKINLY